MAQEMKALTQRLSLLSHRVHSNPSAEIDWPEALEGDCWYMSPELVSLHGTPRWDRMTEAEQKKLSFWELVNFFSITINGEKQVIEGITKRLYLAQTVDMDEFLHHFLDEENKHMEYFGRFCTRYARKIYLDKDRFLPADEDDLVFLAKIMIFEEISDYYNVVMMNDERIHPLVKQINRLHHLDEVRHIAFGRRAVLETFKTNYGEASPEKLAGLREYLSSFVDSAWASYFNPALYEDAGIEKSYGVSQMAKRAPASEARLAAASKSVLGFLHKGGVLPDPARAAAQAAQAQ